MAAAALLAAVSLAALAAAGAAALPWAEAQQDTACREGLEPIVRNADGSIACVTTDTRAVLVARGWGSEPAVPDAAAAAVDETDMGGSADAADNMAATGEPAMDDAAGVVDEDIETVVMPDVPMVELTDDESERLAGAGSQVRVAYDPLRIPVEFYAEDAAPGGDDNGGDAGRLGGVSGAYLDWIKAALPADFVLVDIGDLTGAPVRPHEAVRDETADVAMAISPADEMRDYMSFTSPHTTMPIVLVTVEGGEADAGSLSGMSVGAVSGYGAARWLDETSVDYTGYATGIEAVAALDAGTIDVFVGLWAVASNAAMMADPPVAVANAGPTGQSEELSIGYASSDAPLGSALEKALASVSEEMRAGVAMVADDPLAVLSDQDALAELSGGDETVSSLFGAADEIDELNSLEGKLVPRLLELPAAVAFDAKHSDYTDTFFPFSMESVELFLESEDGATLRIEYSPTDDMTLSMIYNCVYPDGTEDSYMGDDLADEMPTLCVPDSGSP